jgi:hypothetical protein
LESPDEGRRHVEPVLGTDGAPPPGQPESPYLSLDELLFGAVSRPADATPDAPGDPVEEPSLLDEDRFVEEHEFGDNDEVIDDDEVVGDDELDLEDTIVAEPAEIEGVTDRTGAGRGRRRVWVLAGLVTLIVVAGTAAGAVVIGGRSADSAPDKRGPVRKVPSGTTTPTVPTTALPTTASTPASVTTAPLTLATAPRSAPPSGTVTQPAPPPPTTSPPPPATPPPPPPTSPPTTTTPSTTSQP